MAATNSAGGEASAGRRGQWATPAAFDDLRVLEIGNESVDFCGMLLAGEGADVVKVEPPGGSTSRQIGPFYEDKADPNRSLFYWTYNRGKRGVTLDLDREEDRRRYLELASRVDAIIDAEGLGRMDALGLGYDEIEKINPGVVYCSITPFGLTGPWRNFKTSDLIHQALGGTAFCLGYNAVSEGVWDTPPFMAQTWHSYAITAEHASVAIAAALFYRQATGEGQFIDTSIHDCCAQSTEATVTRYLYDKRRMQVRRQPQQLPCKDGRYLAIVSVVFRQAKLSNIRAAVAGSEAARDLEDKRWEDNAYWVSTEAAQRMMGVLAKWSVTKTADEVFHALQRCNIVCGPVRPPEDLIEDAQSKARGDFIEIEHPELGKSFIYPKAPNDRTGTPWRWGPRAPLLGEHNAEVWAELRRKT